MSGTGFLNRPWNVLRKKLMQSKPSKGLNSLQSENQLSEMSQSLTRWEWVMLLSNAWHIFRSAFGWSSIVNALLDWCIAAFNRKGFGMIQHAFDWLSCTITFCIVLDFHWPSIGDFCFEVPGTYEPSTTELWLCWNRYTLAHFIYMYILCSHIYIHIHI